jgi:hypothetical protein
MNTEHTERHHSSIHAATAIDRSNPLAPKRDIAKDIVESSRRLRTRIGVIAAACIGVTALLVAFE